jgi:Na+/H+-dicarboxylate symporter
MVRPLETPRTDMQLHTKILLGLVLGAVLGMTANLLGLEWLRQVLFTLEPMGQAFIKLITMVVIPLVAASLLVGTASLGDLRKLGRIGGKTLGFFLATTAAAVALGLVLSQLITPGSGINPETRDSLSAGFEGVAAGRLEMAAEAPGLKETLLGLIPSNPIGAAANGELLPLIVFVLLFGAATSTLGESRRLPVLHFFQGVNDAVMVIIRWIMRLAPYAVFALVGPIAARFGLDVMQALLVYVATITLGMAILAFGLYAVLVRVLAKLSPLDFYRKIAAPALVALSTSSSSATLPGHHGDGREASGGVQGGVVVRPPPGGHHEHGRDGPLSRRLGDVHRPALRDRAGGGPAAHHRPHRHPGRRGLRRGARRRHHHPHPGPPVRGHGAPGRGGDRPAPGHRPDPGHAQDHLQRHG